jgi:hypothetical protein
MLFLLAADAVLAQGITPFDSSEALHFSRVTREAKQAGYANPVVVGRGSEPMKALFAVLATKKQEGVLLAMLSPGSGATSICELERAATPVDIAVDDVRFLPFLENPALIDAAVLHKPFMLESSGSFETHHLMRRKGKALSACGEFAGSATSWSSKGMGSMGSSRRITVEKLPSEQNLLFRVTTVETTMEQAPGVDTARTLTRNESVKTYELPPKGPFIVR